MALTFPLTAGEATDSALGVVDSYLEALASTLHGEATIADVDKLIALYTEDVVYEHPRVGIKIEGRDHIKQGLLRFLGAYGGQREDSQVELRQQIMVANMVTVYLRVSFQVLREGQVESVERKQAMVFEIEGEKIKRLIDYW